MTKHITKRYIDTKRVVLSIIGFMAIAILLGTILFHLAEGRNYFHSLYFTVITFSTIGYGDITPATHFGKIIAMVYALLGVPLFVGITSVIMEIRFKKFVFHHFEHNTNSLKKAEAEIKRELVQEELKNAQQSKKIEKIEKKLIKPQKDSFLSRIFKIFKK